MFRIFNYIILSGFVFSISQAQVSVEQKSRLSSEMNMIANIFATQYGPRQWKEKHLNWNLQDQLSKSLLQINQAASPRDYRKALADFVGSTQDYHVSVRFISTEKASLPLALRTIEGKALIVDINRDKLSEDSFPFSIGDELVAIDGQAVADVSKELLASLGGGNVPTTDLAWTDMFLLRRTGRVNLAVPRGPVVLTILKADHAIPVNHQLTWEYQGEDVPGSTSWSKWATAEVEKTKTGHPLPQMVADLTLDTRDFATNWSLGEKESFMPALGDKLWSTDENSIFDAYTYVNENGKIIGVIRLPSYTPDDVDAAVKEMAQILTKMQKQTNALVIDQVNNPGGSVFYLYTLVSMMVSDSAVTPRHRMILNEPAVMEAVQTLKDLRSVTNDKTAQEALGATLSGYPVTYQIAVNIRDYSQFVIDQWKAGKRLSDPYFIWGVDHINPSTTVRYTKPILLLVNELDFSGGDFFPAIMQDNKRATIMGTRTAGAGGYVGSLEFPNLMGFESLNFTGSIAERVDRNPIENLGVTPDIDLKLTVDDVRNGFKKYTTQVKETINKLAL
jgi:hypothetical protein